MGQMFSRAMSTVVWGGLIAGPLAALAMVQAPASWGGAFIPLAVLVACIGGVAFWRRAATPRRANRDPRSGDRPEV
jgi:hypothetical protein